MSFEESTSERKLETSVVSKQHHEVRYVPVFSDAGGTRRYVSGGCHPMHIGDVLNNGRYEIVNKIAPGWLSIVWAARDNQNANKIVAIKVLRADRSQGEVNELKVLQHIEANGNTEHPGRRFLPQLLDYFYCEGPNGRHLCLVLNVLGPTLRSIRWDSEFSPRLPCSLSRHVSRQLILAVDFLHSIGIVHGDISEDNIAFQIPRIERVRFDAARKGKLRRMDGEPLGEHVPQYLVEPLAHWRYAEVEELSDIQLIDFSASFFEAKPAWSVHRSMDIVPPEATFMQPLNRAMDIWNLACVTYRYVTGGDLFNSYFEPTDHRSFVPQMLRVLGEDSAPWMFKAWMNVITRKAREGLPPLEFKPAEEELPLIENIRECYFYFKNCAQRKRLLYGRDGSIVGYIDGEEMILYDAPEEHCPEVADEPEDYSGDEEDEEFLAMATSYLTRMLVADPSKRATASELMLEPFVQDTRFEPQALGPLRSVSYSSDDWTPSPPYRPSSRSGSDMSTD
ncbi:kinase-like protein [Aaosphaeria arxii CBS 175.79]|uniref:Kinase-like protein n=1 Tax=Aaosphaeria arxii CBS 175.79 TaxID=1450172 RepID=A0A6A5Y2S5_9PLEO|nr:kinase-like protein [Aaosphaeria arxii CBS 175.79]KAF2019533.1 kinase-like protein [Aaosphaeria arxii CBS 175.79]